MFQLSGERCLSAGLLLLSVLPFNDAGQVNRTIDDTKGDIVTGAKPTYLPTTGGVWAGADCAGCAVQPNPSLAFDGTWTAATYHAILGMTSIQLQFAGTAIYVYFILPNTVAPGITTQTECNFTLDGQAAGSFFHAPSSSFEFIYNALVFSSSNLPNTAHALNISTSGVDHDVFINFDYAIYTTNDTPAAASSPSQTPSSLSPANLASTTTSHSTSQISSTTSLTSNNTTSLSTTHSNSSPSRPSIITTTNGANSTSQTASAFSSNGHKGNSTLIGAAVGGSAGAVAVLLLLFFLLCRRRRRNIQNAKTSPTIPIPFKGAPSSTSSSTNRPTSEFFPARIPTTYSSDPGSRADLLGPNYNHEYPNEVTSPLSILNRREEGPTTSTGAYAIPLRPLRNSEASRQLRQHMGMGTIRRPAVSDRKQHMQLQEQQQRSWWVDESPPEYSSELSATEHRYRPSPSFLRTSGR